MRMRKRKIGFMSGLFGILGVLLALTGVMLALSNREASPILTKQPESARNQVTTMLDALCQGEYDTVSSCLYGKPNLGMDGEAAEEVGQLFWDALRESFSYEILGDFHATDSGVALDVSISAMNLSAVTANLGDRATAVMEQRIADAEDTSEIYDENNEYREEFVMGALYTAAQEALEEDAEITTWKLTLNLICENGQWWIMPESGLLNAISGGILN